MKMDLIGSEEDLLGNMDSPVQDAEGKRRGVMAPSPFAIVVE